MVTDSPNQQLTLRLRHLKLVESRASLEKIPPGKVLINTINANSYNTAQKDQEFAKALLLGDYLIPDGFEPTAVPRNELQDGTCSRLKWTSSTRRGKSRLQKMGKSL